MLPDANTLFALVATACLGLIAIATRTYLPRPESYLPLPPSPLNRRLLEHLIPLHNSFLTIAGWIDLYGPLITIRLGTEKIVIIGRYKAAVDIMEKQAGSVAGRPRLVAAGEILNGGMSIGFISTGDRLRRMRRALHTHLQPRAAQTYEPLQMSHARIVILDILDDPHNFQDYVASYAAATIMKIAYGKSTPTSATDPEIQEVYQLFERFREVLRPGVYHLAELIPWLKYLPWYGRELKRDFKKSKRICTDQLNRVKQQIASADIGPSFMKYLLENEDLYGLTEIEMAFLAGSFFGAGSDTVAAATSTVLMAAACFPKELAKVHAEIDAHIGRHRAPTFDDKQSLPRLGAFISEALRWRPPTANGFPHQTTEDVIWENYRIPAGTTVLGNHWAISRDPEVYPEPDAFKPQRWINDQGRLKEDLKLFIFGFGRRTCPGQHVGNRSVFICSLLVLWAFQLTLDPTKPLNDMGFMNGATPRDKLCAIEFKTRVPETEIRRMMHDYPGVA